MRYSNQNFIDSCGDGTSPTGKSNVQGGIAERVPVTEESTLQQNPSMLMNDSKAEARALFVANYKRNDFDPEDEGDNIWDSLMDRMRARYNNLWSWLGGLADMPWWLKNRVRQDKTTDKDGLECKNQYAGLFTIKENE